MLIYFEKKMRDKKPYIVFSFARFQQSCFSQTKLLNNTALHEFKKLNSWMELPLQTLDRESVKYVTESTFVYGSDYFK